MRNLKKILPDFFITGIILMIILAWLMPEIGENGSPLELDQFIYYGISLLFFFYGLQLSPARLLNDLKDWKLHLLIQAITYVLFPVIVLLFFPFFSHSSYRVLWLAVFFLAVLPSTVSSSVVMVSIAGGNIPTAIFNASISGIIGLFITPLWMSRFMNNQNSSFSFFSVMIDLTFQILIPLIIGLIFHRYWGNWANRHKKQLALFDKGVIFCIVYHSFSHSFSAGIFQSIAPPQLIILLISVIGLFFIVFESTKWLSRRLKFNRETQITIQFCGSKKSLIHGSVMASVLFAGSPYGSLFLVPVMIYHAFQLFYISIVARHYRETAANTDC